MRLSEKLKKDTEDIWEKIYHHPFVEKLFEGTLPEKKFKNYILQDYNYLVSSIKNFSLLAAKADDVNIMKELITMAYTEATGEFKGYESFLEKLNLDIKQAENEKQVPEAVSYTSYLFFTSSFKSLEEGITAVLPCYWTYEEIARVHQKKLTSNNNPIYKEWAYYYLEDSYLTFVNKIKKIVDGIDSNFPYHKLIHAFRTSSRYEYMFWDAMYTMDNKLNKISVNTNNTNV
ncbi:MAG: thiaminase II [bacterium]